MHPLGFPAGDDRGGRGHRQHRQHGQQQRQSNPFELMDSHMSQMGSMMDMGFGGFGGGASRMSHMMDQMMGPMGSMGSMASMGGGGGSSCSYSSCSYSSCGGPGRSCEYSSTSHGVQRPGEQMVREMHRNYRDSSGEERLGVSRHIGDRGRSIVAERGRDGRETRTDNLVNISDGTRFDQEWRNNAGATTIEQTRQATRTHGTMLGAPATMGTRGMTMAPPSQSAEDRAAALEGQRNYEQQRDRMIAEARAQREQRPSHRSSALAPHSGAPARVGGTAAQSDAALASRMAQQEARRAGLY